MKLALAAVIFVASIFGVAYLSSLSQSMWWVVPAEMIGFLAIVGSVIFAAWEGGDYL